MKKLITFLTILTVLSVIAITYYINQPQPTVQVQQSTKQITTKQETIQQQDQHITHAYIITEVVQHDNKDTEYYGHSTTSNTGIYFTSDYINFIGSLEEGDTITAHFENEYDDSLLYVNKN